MHIYIDPRDKILYDSYYIQGLEDKYGSTHVHFSTCFFKDLNRKKSFSYDHYMAYVMKDDSNIVRVIVDYHDSVSVAEIAYEWCDVYAKINIENKDVLYNHPKMVSIPPGFGIKIWSVSKTIRKCISNRLKCLFLENISSLKEFIYGYAVMALKRKPLLFYLQESISPKDKYVFHTSTMWANSDCQNKTNPIRASFIRACKVNTDIQYEGGLVCKWDNPPEYKDILSPRYKMEEYLLKTKQSLFVFNTPAVLGCHGWKLGEYFAMGKAIITTPLSNVLPFGFKDEDNCLIVRNEKEISEAIERLVKDKTLIEKLEASSRYIYDNYSSPLQVINTINKKLGL